LETWGNSCTEAGSIGPNGCTEWRAQGMSEAPEVFPSACTGGGFRIYAGLTELANATHRDQGPVKSNKLGSPIDQHMLEPA
jgi:hypothetical protein